MITIVIHFRSGKAISVPLLGSKTDVVITQNRDGDVDEIFVEDEVLTALDSEGVPFYYNKKEIECIQVLDRQ